MPCRGRRPMVRNRASSAARSGAARTMVSRTANRARPPAPATDAQNSRAAERPSGSRASRALSSAPVCTAQPAKVGLLGTARTSSSSAALSGEPRANHRVGCVVWATAAVAGPAGRTRKEPPTPGRAGVPSTTPAPFTGNAPALSRRSSCGPDPASRAKSRLNSAGTGVPAAPGASRAGSNSPHPTARASCAYVTGSATTTRTLVDPWSVPNTNASSSVHTGTDSRTPGSAAAASRKGSGRISP